MFYELPQLARFWTRHWPAACDVCGSWPTSPVCGPCRQDHAPVLRRCTSCALPLAPGLTQCTACTQASPNALSGVMARVAYQYPWVDVVRRFKFGDEPGLATHLAALMGEAPEIAQTLHQADWVTPIPLPPNRLRERGYNQAWELVKALRRQLSKGRSAFDTHPTLLQRPETTDQQHTLPRAQRLAAGGTRFTTHPDHLAVISGAHIVLVDDVMTTGATLQAAAQTLLDAGAASVRGVVFARTPAPGTP